MCKSYGICRTRVVYCNQDKHAWHFHKYLMSNHSSAMILWLSKISLISNQQDFHNLQPSKELVEPTSNNGMETCLQMHFLVRGNMLICMGGRRGGRLSRMAAKSSAISSLASATEKALFLGRAGGGGGDASGCSGCPRRLPRGIRSWRERCGGSRGAI
jgi:hypothetical protein